MDLRNTCRHKCRKSLETSPCARRVRATCYVETGETSTTAHRPMNSHMVCSSGSSWVRQAVMDEANQPDAGSAAGDADQHLIPRSPSTTRNMKRNRRIKSLQCASRAMLPPNAGPV